MNDTALKAWLENQGFPSPASLHEMVRLLLEAGADPVLETLDGFTALELAANRACMKLLRAVQLAA